MFGRLAFIADAEGGTFHQLALREGKRWESRVAKSLSEKVFVEVFPTLADALAKTDTKRDSTLSANYLERVREGALILLYRLLFVLYAEDRNLLPNQSEPYSEYCLTKLRFEIADREDKGALYPRSLATLWPRLSMIFDAIARGNDELGIPPYNGGLFDQGAAPILLDAILRLGFR